MADRETLRKQRDVHHANIVELTADLDYDKILNGRWGKARAMGLREEIKRLAKVQQQLDSIAEPTPAERARADGVAVLEEQIAADRVALYVADSAAKAGRAADLGEPVERIMARLRANEAALPALRDATSEDIAAVADELAAAAPGDGLAK